MLEQADWVLDMLKRHEGERRRGGRHAAYRCSAGALTIGWGHNLDASPVPGLGVGSRIGDEEAEALLREDAAGTARALDARLPWWRDLDEVRGAVLLDMAFNMGAARLCTFRRTLEDVKAGRWDEAATAMLDSCWASQVGHRAVELAAMMRKGGVLTQK